MPEINLVLTAIGPGGPAVVTLYAGCKLALTRFRARDTGQSNRGSVEQSGIRIILQADEFFTLISSWIGSEA
jgi:hypothetical protein